MMRSRWRVPAGAGLLIMALAVAYFAWQPGTQIVDGRHDRGENGLWLGHGWLGADEWFVRHGKRAEMPEFRTDEAVMRLARLVNEQRIRDVFPHLCPTTRDGRIAAVDDEQARRFLAAMDGVRVIPWIGGVHGDSVHLEDPEWRRGFCDSVRELLEKHPRLAGVQVNVEPCPSGDEHFLKLLEEVRAVLPPGRILSVAAYPPPTRWQPSLDVHWEEAYFREVAKRADQLAVMMYDTSIRWEKPYVALMAKWTRQALAWSEGADVLMGVPTYADEGVAYHDPKVEGLQAALRGVHRGLRDSADAGELGGDGLPERYRGVAIYCEWETDATEWALWRSEFLRGTE